MCVLLGFVNLAPNLTDVLVDHAFDLSLLDTRVEVTEDKD